MRKAGLCENIFLHKVIKSNAHTLYKLLAERAGDKRVNISNVNHPDYHDHVNFVNKHLSGTGPYKHWYMVRYSRMIVGSVYLTHQNEIGIFLFKKFQRRGLGGQIIKQLFWHHPEPYFLANVNPKNTPSKKMFKRLGFVKIQETYRVERESFMADWKLMDDKMRNDGLYEPGAN